jgi:hypothetical protein
VDTIALSDEWAVDAARTAYDALSDGVQALLTEEKTKLEGLKEKIEERKKTATPQELAEAFKSVHAAVLGKTVENIALSDEAAVNAALAAYNALSAEAQALLTAEKATLDALKAKIDGLKALAAQADAFKTGHAAILAKTPDTIALSDEAVVDAALTAYNDLGEAVKALLSAEKTKLDDLKTKIDDIKASTAATVSGLQNYLAGKPVNDADTPYTVSYTGTGTSVDIYNALETADRFVNLDLSASSVTGFATGTEAGRVFIVSLILPDSLTAIPILRVPALTTLFLEVLQTLKRSGPRM